MNLVLSFLFLLAAESNTELFVSLVFSNYSYNLISYCDICKSLLFVKKICTVYSETSYKIVPLTNLNKYLYNDESEIKVNINVNNSGDTLKKNIATKIAAMSKTCTSNSVSFLLLCLFQCFAVTVNVGRLTTK